MNIGNIPAFDQVTPNEHPLFGSLPVYFTHSGAPDGDASPWKEAPVGSKHYRRVTAAHTVEYTKVTNYGQDYDWAGIGRIGEYISVADFTDGGAAAGTKALATQIPAGAVVQQAVVKNVTGFAGNVSAVMIIGDGTTTNRYNTGTPSVFATAAVVEAGVPSGVRAHATAATVTVTVTTSADFTACKSNGAGRAYIEIIYFT